MSINYCTLASTTVDTFCGAQRAKILARLITEAGHDVPPVVGGHGHPQTWGRIPGIRQQPIYRPQREREPDVREPVYHPEQPWITVTVAEFLGMQGAETLEATSRLDFVTVTDLAVTSDVMEISVNISEMEILNAARTR